MPETPFVRGDEDLTALGIYEFARFALMFESVAVMVLVFWMAHLMGGWRTMDPINRFRLSGGLLLQVALGYGAAEAELTGVGPAPRNLILAIAVGYLGTSYAMTIAEIRRANRARGDEDET